MNTITYSFVHNIAAVCGVIALAFVLATPIAHAADYYDYGWVDTGYYDTYSPSYDYGWVDTGYYDTYTPSYDYGWVDTGYYDTYNPSYSYPSYSYPSYSSPGFYSGGGFYYGPSGSSGGGSQTQTQTQQQQQTQTQTTTVTNTNTNNNTITVNIPATQVVQPVNNYYNTYTQPTCQSGWYGTYPNCYKYNPVVYNNPTTPYVTLSQVPYTGLELGPVGTAIYWGFLMLWALFIAYLLVIKRVQIGIYRSLNAFLFGSEVEDPANAVLQKSSVSSSRQGRDLRQDFAHQHSPAQISVDPFIAAQISRARA